MTAFEDLLEWYVEGFVNETPTNSNRRGVWHGDFDIRARGPMSSPTDLAGGSRLGSPDQSEVFRRYIEDHPRKTAHGGRYRRPFRAALAELRGRHRCGPIERRQPGHDCGSSPTIALYLFALGMAQGDWQTVGASFDILPAYRQAYALTALRRLEANYSSYDLRPSWVDKSDAQRVAEEAS